MFKTETDDLFTFALNVCFHFRRNNETTRFGGRQEVTPRWLVQKKNRKLKSLKAKDGHCLATRKHLPLTCSRPANFTTPHPRRLVSGSTRLIWYTSTARNLWAWQPSLLTTMQAMRSLLSE